MKSLARVATAIVWELLQSVLSKNLSGNDFASLERKNALSLRIQLGVFLSISFLFFESTII